MFARMAQSYNEHPTTRTADILKYGTIKLVHAYHLQKPISGLCAFADDGGRFNCIHQIFNQKFPHTPMSLEP